MGSPASRSTQLLVLLLIIIFASSVLSSKLEAPGTAAAVDWPPPRFSFSFNFTNASSYHIEDLRFEGDAELRSDKLVDLTCNSYQGNINRCVGRMSYAQAVPFSTSFTFAMKPSKGNFTGDGMAFFLTGYPSSLPADSGGRNLGLHNDTSANGNGRFIAVEFDSFVNSIDRDAYGMGEHHIGIDLNSVRSVNTTNVLCPVGSGSDDYNGLRGSMTAFITFHNTTRKLVASLQLHDPPCAHSYYEVSAYLPDPVTLLPPEVAVGFSAATGDGIELHQLMAWSFNSTIQPPRPKGQDKKPMIIGGGLVVLLVFVLIVWFIISYCKWTRRGRAFEEQGTGGPRRFEYSELVSATKNFSTNLGQGGFGVVYRGSINNLSRDVAVKVLKVSGLGGCKDFFSEINTISEAKHKNLVKLVGWCRKTSLSVDDFLCWCRQSKGDMLFLVYELVPNGNLEEHLQKQDPVLSWETRSITRYKIVKDISYALVYLHEECYPYILHRDIKPSNILLDNDFNAKLADFGLSRIADQNNIIALTAPIGSIQYMDPQLMKNEEVQYNRSSDIYSFGLVLLEIACGVGAHRDREKTWSQYTKNKFLLQAADGKLQGNFNPNQMEVVIGLGLWCSFRDDTKRPTIREAMDVLEHGVQLPNLKSLFDK